MATHHYDYSSARARFLSLAKPLAAKIETIVHPMQGPDGEIAMDIATFGNPEAQSVLVISSATHGVEGYCGSFIQCELLSRGIIAKLPEDFSLIMIHGVNPHGFAWQRRVNEDNIDLNRNFIDHDTNTSQNVGYPELAELLEPESWDDAVAAEMWQKIFAVANQHSDEPGWQAMAITSGQTEYPNGVFYAGNSASWSNQKIRQFVGGFKRQVGRMA